MKTKCLIQTNPIPDNFIGAMTMPLTNAISTQVYVRFVKPTGAAKILTTTTGVDGSLALTTDITFSDFFSHRYDGIRVEVVEKPGYEPVSFIDPDDSSLKDGLLLSFVPAHCDYGSNSITLSKKADGCSC